MTDASSTTHELDARVREMGHAMVQMQRDLEYRFERLDAALTTIQTAVAGFQAGGGGRAGRHPKHHDRGGGFHTPKPKLEPPKSDGAEPLRWLYQVQEYFAYYETPPEERLRCVTMMLEGQAADWFRWRRNNGLIADWDDFVLKFKLRFDPLHYVDYVGQLARVRQSGGVMEYQAAFEKVLTHVTDVPEPYLQSLFHAGLKNHLQHEISLLKPETLSESFALARELEAKHQAIVHSVGLKSSSWGTNFNRGNPSRAVAEGSAGSVTKPAQISSGVKATSEGRESSNTPPIKRLTRAERLEKDAKGLCYNCDQKWHKGHKCGRFIRIMGEDDGEEEEPEEDEEIEVAADISSLNSMSGVTTPRSLRLTGKIGQQGLDVLIDGGSTHNFVHPRTVEKLGLSLEKVAAFRVYVGNGDSLCCTQQCRNVALELQGTTFTVDLYVLQIHGHDVVLGVQWLRGLGRVLHDYEKVTMEFAWGEQTVTLRGDAVVPKQTSLHHLRALHARHEVDAGILLMVAEAEDTEKGESGATEEGLPRGIAALLERFDEVFKEPQGLPPHCTVDHRIYLQPGVAPVNPLPVPSQVWEDISMDFIVGLPPSRGYTVIMVVVDRLTKVVHLGALPAGFDAHRTAHLFIDIVVKLHGFPKTIVSDRDRVFLSNFWREALKASGTTLAMSTSFHPQTDGQTEVMNRAVEQYLRAFAQDKPSRWTVLLPWAEYALNTSVHSGLKRTPFEALYGRPPPTFLPYRRGDSKVPEVDNFLQERDSLLRRLRENLKEAQRRMTQTANRHRTDLKFKEGDWVLLKLQPYRQHSVVRRSSQKLARRYYGPYRVLARIGEAAYRLELPPGSRIHPVFHVSLMRPYYGESPEQEQLALPSEFVHGQPLSEPARILAERQVLVRGTPEKQCLVEWTDGGRDDVTWEPYDRLHQRFPTLHLEDKVASQAEGNVTQGLHGSRKETSSERDKPVGRARAKQTEGKRNVCREGREEIREPRTRKAPGWHDDYVLNTKALKALPHFLVSQGQSSSPQPLSAVAPGQKLCRLKKQFPSSTPALRGPRVELEENIMALCHCQISYQGFADATDMVGPSIEVRRPSRT
ncbi:unnamed protein product [Cuscuta campestris]|uniref:Integrase catalytic domain-containing protein n=1 Tax=Cuscuta campestris TaxID=132261 RepID=A0A484L7G1_9ASTE|nr:unnamed protein product [Cuscuta campestris]